MMTEQDAALAAMTAAKQQGIEFSYTPGIHYEDGDWSPSQLFAYYEDGLNPVRASFIVFTGELTEAHVSLITSRLLSTVDPGAN